jgi:hypothetical protein
MLSSGIQVCRAASHGHSVFVATKSACWVNIAYQCSTRTEDGDCASPAEYNALASFFQIALNARLWVEASAEADFSRPRM